VAESIATNIQIQPAYKVSFLDSAYFTLSACGIVMNIVTPCR
jgi:hypothetical protein